MIDNSATGQVIGNNGPVIGFGEMVGINLITDYCMCSTGFAVITLSPEK